MYRLETSKDVDKFLEKAVPKLRNRVLEVFEELCNDPFSNAVDTKPMVNKKGHFRLRVGKYRFLYTIIEDEILVYVYKADSRGDIYK
jgi:mRNA interferase RelE/StbE